MEELIGTLPIGTYLQNGKYKIEKNLGQGGFGITYKAKCEAIYKGNIGEEKFEVPVAIKEFFMRENCIRDNTTSSIEVATKSKEAQVEQYKRKFIKEAHNIASLNHSHIVNVTDVFEENNTIYYVMQYVPGGSLRDYVKSQQNGCLSENEAMQYILQIADALKYMHNEKRMCHFDVKPSNILLEKHSDGNNALLIDFGMSKIYDSTGHETSTTPIGLSKGFAPIEQYNPATLKDFSPQTDIYSLGATYYYCLTGDVPPEAGEILEYFPEKPDIITERAWAAIKNAMQPKRQDRSKNIDTFKDLIINGDDETIIIDDPGPNPGPNPGPKPKLKHNTLLIICITIFVFIIGFFIVQKMLRNNAVTKDPIIPVANVTNKSILADDGTTLYIYTGQLTNNLPEGKGKAVYKDGRIYEGNFVAGQREGDNANFKFANGDTFIGSFSNDKIKEGTFRCEQPGNSYGMYFVGKFKDDKPYTGIWYKKDGSILSKIANGFDFIIKDKNR